MEGDIESRGPRDPVSMLNILEPRKMLFYIPYFQSLKDNQSLRGKITVRIFVEPSGKVSAAEVVSSELADRLLEKRILEQAKQIDFLPQFVRRSTLEYTFDFFRPFDAAR